MIKRKNQLQKLAMIMRSKGKTDIVHQIRAMKAVESDTKKSGIMQKFLLAISKIFL